LPQVRQVGLALLAALAMPAVARSQPAPASPATLDLDQAVRLTLELSPDIHRTADDVRLAQGRLRETSGTFDSLFRIKSTFGYVETELDPDTIEQEQARRIALFSVAQTFAQLREDVAQRIAKRQLQVPICPAGFTDLRLLPAGRSQIDLGLNRPICIPIGLGTDTPEGLVSRALQALFKPPGAVDTTGLTRQLRTILGLLPDDRIAELEQLGLEQLERSQRLSNLVADLSVLSLERLGLVPETEFRKTLALEFRLDKQLRNGSFVALEGRLSGQERNYRGKPLDPTFGGLGLENEFRAGLFLIVDQPLGKGRGSVSARAAERAAAASLEAARRRHEQAVSERALATIRAHVDLLAAEESLALLEQSVAAQRTIQEAIDQLVKAGDRARSELTRAQAGLADAETAASGARLSVASARGELARVVGLDPVKVGIGPLASGSFPTALVELPDVNALQQQAAAARLDLRAAEEEERASQITFEAARADLRRRFDLSVNVGMASDYRSPFFRVLRDEFINNPTEPPEGPVDYYSPRGFWRTLKNKYLPEVRVQLRFEIPFGNNAARGRMERNLQTLRQSEIRTTDLARVIRQNVAAVGASLRAARAEVEERRKAVSDHEATWKAAQDLQKAGELSLVDTLLTEQDLTTARLQLVQALRNYAASLARLRFEAGALVRFKDGTPVGFDLAGLLSPP
jgi:outer membrane protein TolC